MQIKPFTLSVVVGSLACNARCPFCVARMTKHNGVGMRPDPINWKNWDQTVQLARQSGVTTVLLTSKGEPTLFPDQVDQFLDRLSGNFPIIEMQTNAIRIADGTIGDEVLQRWFDKGLRVIAISNVGPDPDLGREIYTPHKNKYIQIQDAVKRLKSIGFSIRLTTMMVKDGITDADRMKAAVDWARDLDVEQITIRPIVATDHPEENEEAENVREWALGNAPTDDQLTDAYSYVESNGIKLLELPHGANVYDVGGQNVCIANCLTESTNPDTIRQLIYFPDGHLRYSWQYKGAVLL